MTVEFKGRWFAKELILQCIRWYPAYKLSYRDLEGLRRTLGTKRSRARLCSSPSQFSQPGYKRAPQGSSQTSSDADACVTCARVRSVRWSSVRRETI